ncbi:MAG TPA: hypothetical protein ENI96_01825 [Sedimenticola thiotaurini]|uniref:Uncharacterized protein n=1 Tax=Sedimenticola thiotaurini TaxID=1543721 RepID=A0A831RMB3_9GAMM|nr:hypothetical protein [Sedimenticola thiotaurini]
MDGERGQGVAEQGRYRGQHVAGLLHPLADQGSQQGAAGHEQEPGQDDEPARGGAVQQDGGGEGDDDGDQDGGAYPFHGRLLDDWPVDLRNR